MTHSRIAPLALGILLTVTLPLGAQEEEQDPGFLERMIQNALGGDGREVRIVGLEGALSSEVTIATIEVSDPDGTWLTVHDVTMAWRRLALLRGRVEIDSLTIGSVDLPRTPLAAPAEAPSIEADPEPAQPFSLPDLPVSLEVGEFGVARLTLGAPVVGQDAELSIDGAARLVGGEGSADLKVVRLDGPEGLISLNAGFENETRRLFVNLDVEEAEGGLIATLAKFPGAPSVDLSIAGDNPISDFTADIALATDGEPRLNGTVEIGQTNPGERLVTTIAADIGGDITPLFAPQYQDFFGPDVGLTARVLLDPETGTDVEQFALSSYALNLNGALELTPAGLPRLVDINGSVGAEDGLPVTLPLPGELTELNSGVLRVDYNADEGDAFLARFGLLGLRQGDLSVGTVNLALDGTLSKTDAPLTITQVATDLTATMSGISVNDPTLDNAFAPPVTFDANILFDPDPGTVAVRDLALVSGDLRLDGTVDVSGVGGDIEIATDADLTTGDLARFAPITGQALTGAFDGALKARFAALTGAFDVDLQGAGQDLAIGNPQVDPLIAGASEVAIKAARNASGITIDALSVKTAEVDMSGGGALSSTSADLTLEAHLAEANYLAPQLNGPLSLSASAQGLAPDYTVALTVGDEAIVSILGDPVTLNSDLAYNGPAGTLDVRNLILSAGALNAEGSADVTGLDDAPAVSAELDLKTGDLARLATLTGMPLAGSLNADVDGDYDTGSGDFNATVTGRGQDIAIGNPQVDQLLAGTTDIDVAAQGVAGTITIERLDVHNPELSLTGGGSISAEGGDIAVQAALREVNPFVPHLSGPVTLDAKASGQAPDFTIELDAGGEAITSAIGDPISLTSELTYDADGGTLDVRDLILSAGDLLAKGTAHVTALQTQPAASANLDIETGDLGRLAPLAGLPLAGTLSATLNGGYDTGSGDFNADIDGRGQDIAIGTAQVDQLLAGTTVIDIAAQRTDGDILIERLNIDNPELTVNGSGTIADTGGNVTLNARLDDLGLFVPQLQGPLSVDGTGTGAGTDWDVNLTADGPAGLRAVVAGGLSPTDIDLDIDAGLANLGVFVPEIPGPVTITGAVTGNGTDYFVDVTTTGPVGLNAAIDGRAYGPDGTMDLNIDGTIPLRLADGFIAPRSLSGNASVDLALDGTPGLDALSGSVTMSGARFTDPTSRIVLEQMGLNLSFANSQANLDFNANLDTGGRISVSGPVALSAPYNGDIVVALQNLKVIDPDLYTIDVNGRIALSGPLAGGATIQGRIDIPRAEITIPAAIGGGGPIPDMVHQGEPAESRRTRDRAGLIKKPDGDGTTGAPVAYPLDLLISAPNQIFIRGRGLDTELGGQLTITGTTQRPIPSGRFELVRGRMDILSQVLIFSESTITLGGDLVPQLYMVAQSEDATIDAQIEIAGPVNDPELSFSSSPTLPEDEVLSQLFFGKPVRDLTPLEVAQLLSAISTLTGGGGGVFGKIRDGLGVDQLNVGSDDDGNTEVTAGKYLSEDVYTDVTVGGAGTSRIRLNFDLTPSLTVRGGFDSEGDTRLGITFERDY